ARPGVPMVVSVHGGDVLATATGSNAGRAAVAAGLRGAALVLANSAGTEARARALGAHRTRVVHLGTDLPAAADGRAGGADAPLVTVAHVVARKRHADVLRALALLPGARWVVVGDGPERPGLEALARELGVADRVEWGGALPHAEAVAAARGGSVFVLPSVDEAFGVAYVEAMAGGVPAVGCRGEDGPEEIARSGGGIRLVPPRDPAALAAELRGLLADPAARAALGAEARATVERDFTWAGCGRATVAAYAAAVAGA
ncbi:MAG TPA: glycosyltransferase, partial [Solirubrobacteraceae bacterium]